MGYLVHGSYDDWAQAFDEVYKALPDRAHVPCPNCGKDSLRIEFIGDPDERIGYSEFWCANCNFGIHVSRIDIPDNVSMHPFGTPEEELSKIIPEYTAIYPVPDDEE